MSETFRGVTVYVIKGGSVYDTLLFLHHFVRNSPGKFMNVNILIYVLILIKTVTLFGLRCNDLDKITRLFTNTSVFNT